MGKQISKDKVYITTAIDYANEVIHIGHAFQKVLADILARYWRMKGKKVFFLTGTDEHGANIEQKAKQEKKDPQEYVDEISSLDKEELKSLNISYDRFIRTTDQDHIQTVEWFWKRIKEKGDVYLKEFSGLYCLGCESFKTPHEIVDGKCPLHPTQDLVKVSEENYFFRWSKYEPFLKDLLKKHKDFIVPSSRYKEMVNFLNQGLEDISVSRKSVKWGIPVPGKESEQVFYVWFEALMNYYTGAKNNGFWDDNTYIIHIMGKDNLRWHALLWPAILKSAELRMPDVILGHGFCSLNGQKISKSRGNFIRAKDLVEQTSQDAVRYFLAKYGPLRDDADISLEKVKKAYNSELANNLGNLIQRVCRLAEKNNCLVKKAGDLSFYSQVDNFIQDFKLDFALNFIGQKLDALNKLLDEEKPWAQPASQAQEIISQVITELRQICYNLYPFLPLSMDKALKIINQDKIKTGQPLFPRL